jgi:hypothetical protein
MQNAEVKKIATTKYTKITNQYSIRAGKTRGAKPHQKDAWGKASPYFNGIGKAA